MNRTLLFTLGLASALIAGTVGTDPAAAGGGRNRFDFAPGDFSVAVIGQGNDSSSYYLPFKLTNPMDAARTPRIALEVRTDTGKTYGDRFDARVLNAAKKALKADDLKTASTLRGSELAAGASAQCIGNFGNIDPNSDEFDVRVYGLWDPILRTRQGKVYKESRVLVLHYSRKGDEYGRIEDAISFGGRHEEVVGDVVELYSTGSTSPEKK